MNRRMITLLGLVLVQAPLSAADRSDSARLVENLYRQFAWEAVISMPDPGEPGLIDQPKAVLDQFFTPEITALLLEDRTEAAESGGVGRVDFLPLWDSQDPSASDLKLSAGIKPNTVVVSFLPVGAENRTKLVLVVQETPKGVRIADIEYSGGFSLALLLKADS